MKLLVADDSTTIQKVIELAFEGHGATLVFVSSYLELLSEVGKAKYDCLICDANLTGTGGVGDFSKLLEVAGELPTVLLRGSYDHIDEEVFREAGFQNFLKKPFDADVMVSTVKNILLVSNKSSNEASGPAISIDQNSSNSSEPAPKQAGDESDTPTSNFNSSSPQVTADKGRKAFEETPPDLSLSSVEALSTAGTEERSPALNLDFAEVPADVDPFAVSMLEDKSKQASEETKAVVNQAPVIIDEGAIAAKIMPVLKEQLHTEVRLHLKELVGQKIDLVIRDIVREELRRLLEEKSSLN